MSNPASENQVTDSRNEQGNKKRKRNTIACFQCRVRKRRCTADYIEICENCLREGLECRKPDMDGRKTRWKKGQTALGTDLNNVAGPSGYNGTEEHNDGGHEGLHSGCLFGQTTGSGSPRAEPRTVVTGSDGSRGVGPSIFPEPLSSLFFSEYPGDGVQPGSSNVLSQDTASGQYSNTTHDTLWNGLFDAFSNYDSGAMDPNHLPRTSSSPETSAHSAHVKKVVWWRFHGPSAIAPGLKRITLKVRLDDQVDTSTPTAPIPLLNRESHPHPSPDPVVDEDGMPRHDLMLHLLDVFMTHFGCQYPALSQAQLVQDLDRKSGSTLLFNCIASTASRFSKHPDIAQANLEPHAYGRIFHKTAKNMLGNVLAVPTRETVIALTLLAGISHGVDSESEEWMVAGMAARMAIDLGLHLAPPPDSVMSEEDRRLDRLTFWSVYFLDVALSFGVGRETAFRLASITQTVPTESDLIPSITAANNIGGVSETPQVRKAFAYAARLAFAYGPLVNIVNGPRDDQFEWETQAQQITQQAVEVYNALPSDMQWSAYNLQNLSHACQGSIFVQMHLWMHTILVRHMEFGMSLLVLYTRLADHQASGYLIGTDVLRPDRKAYLHGSMTPSNTTASRLWQHSARTIGDILILSDIVNPFVYHALPFSNQPFVVAGCCYIKDADAQLQRSKFKENPDGNLKQGFGHDVHGGETNQLNRWQSWRAAKRMDTNDRGEKAEMFRTLLQSVTSNNITALQQGLIRQTRYWAGVAWVAEVLTQRMSGISMDDIDLKAVTESLDSTVAMADARMFGQPDMESDVEKQQSSLAHPEDTGFPSAWHDIQLSLEADWLADSTFLQSQGYPVVVDDFTSDWATHLV